MERLDIPATGNRWGVSMRLTRRFSLPLTALAGIAVAISISSTAGRPLTVRAAGPTVALTNSALQRLDHATFTEGSPVSDHAALRGLAIEVGLPTEKGIWIYGNRTVFLIGKTGSVLTLGTIASWRLN